MLDFNRMITTDMSARILADALKQGASLSDVARVIKAPMSFVKGVQSKRHTFTEKDVKAIARLTGQTSNLLILNSLRPIRREFKPLFDSVRKALETSAGIDANFRSTASRKRRTSRAA